MWLQPIVDKFSDLRISVGMRFSCRLRNSGKVVVCRLSNVCRLLSTKLLTS